MNAYELADELERFESFNGDIFFGTCAITLRQQADRIAELEKRGKPVAWMSPDGKVSQTEGKLFYIPLYTTPQTKPLSDEEITEIAEKTLGHSMGLLNWMGFARAIEERHGIK